MNPGSSIKEFIKGFLKDQGLPFEKISLHSLAGDGSQRIFRRITPLQSGPSFVAMENVPNNDLQRRENLSYLMIGKHLFRRGLPVPEIYRFNLQNGWFILEDLGDRNLQDALPDHMDRISLYEKVIDTLFRLQIGGSPGFNTEWCYQTERYDSSVMRRYESDYFRDSFLCNYLGMNRDWAELEGPFDHLSATASRADNHHFLHRDFQARNIMILDGKVGIIDWQGGRLGPLPYDLASLLIEAYDLSASEKDRLFQYYLLLLMDHKSQWVDPFKIYYPYLAIQRNLQILGAFSHLTKVKGKPYFEPYISPALRSLHHLLDELADPKLSTLTDLVNALSSCDQK
ncbi:MAG: phosphotransferase [Deltaproteobacteria bacterium]|nr:phosphotransferase [Deltaproteobacteria bacterium]